MASFYFLLTFSTPFNQTEKKEKDIKKRKGNNKQYCLVIFWLTSLNIAFKDQTDAQVIGCTRRPFRHIEKCIEFELFSSKPVLPPFWISIILCEKAKIAFQTQVTKSVCNVLSNVIRGD